MDGNKLVIRGPTKKNNIRSVDKKSLETYLKPVLLIAAVEEDEFGAISENCIGEYSGVTRTLYLERCGKVVWPGERPPKDRTITR